MADSQEAATSSVAGTILADRKDAYYSSVAALMVAYQQKK